MENVFCRGGTPPPQESQPWARLEAEPDSFQIGLLLPYLPQMRKQVEDNLPAEVFQKLELPELAESHKALIELMPFVGKDLKPLAPEDAHQMVSANPAEDIRVGM